MDIWNEFSDPESGETCVVLADRELSREEMIAAVNNYKGKPKEVQKDEGRILMFTLPDGWKAPENP